MPEAGRLELDSRGEELHRLREHLEKVKEDQAHVTQRKTELIQTVQEQIAVLRQILVDCEAEDQGPAPATFMTPEPPRLEGQVPERIPIIEYVRRELIRGGEEIDTATLRHALVTRHHVPPSRLKNLSQILYKTVAVYKDHGKIGLADWKAQRTSKRRSTKGALRHTS
jgi:small-conductance mechanosensitive channel